MSRATWLRSALAASVCGLALAGSTPVLAPAGSAPSELEDDRPVPADRYLDLGALPVPAAVAAYRRPPHPWQAERPRPAGATGPPDETRYLDLGALLPGVPSDP